MFGNMFAFDLDPQGGPEMLKIPSRQKKPPYVRASVTPWDPIYQP